MRIIGAVQECIDASQDQSANRKRQLCIVKDLHGAFGTVARAQQLKLHSAVLCLILRFEILGETVEAFILTAAPQAADPCAFFDDGIRIAYPFKRILFLEQHHGQRDEDQQQPKKAYNDQWPQLAQIAKDHAVRLG